MEQGREIQMQQVLEHENEQINIKTRAQKIIQLLDYMINKLGIKLDKSRLCKHHGTCISSLLVSSTKIGLFTYSIKTVFLILFSIKNLYSNPSFIIKILFNQNNRRFGLCSASFVAIFRTIICSSRKIFNNNQNQSYLYMFGGFIGGIIATMFLNKSERQFIGLFFIARAIDIGYRSLVKKGYLSENTYFYALLYLLAMAATGYCLMDQVRNQQKWRYSFYKQFINQVIPDMEMRQILLQKKYNKFIQMGIQPHTILYLSKFKPIF